MMEHLSHEISVPGDQFSVLFFKPGEMHLGGLNSAYNADVLVLLLVFN